MGMAKPKLPEQQQEEVYIVTHHARPTDQCDCYIGEDYEDDVRGVFTNKEAATMFVKESAKDAVSTWGYIHYPKNDPKYNEETRAMNRDTRHEMQYHYSIELKTLNPGSVEEGMTAEMIEIKKY
jgi:hypothetical protein